MYRIIIRVLVASAILSLLASCTPPSPTVVATKPAAAPTSAPAATKPAAPGAASPATTAAAPAATKPAATGPVATPAAKVKRGGTLRYAVSWTYPTLDPHLSTASPAPPLTYLLFDELFLFVRDDKTGLWQPSPQIAESWDSPDNTTLVIKLRKGVTFHDGSELNAEAVKWNIDRWITHPKFYAKAYTGNYKSVDVVDPYTVRINLKNPSAATLILMSRWNDSSFSLISKAAFDSLGEEKSQSQPVGSGPMQFVQWQRDDRVTLKKWDKYWMKGADGQPLPYLDGYIERFIQDPSVTLLEMRAGNLEMTENVDAKDIAPIKSNPDLVYLELPWTGSHYFTAGFAAKSSRPEVQNVKVRQAAWHALDRESMAKALGFGIAKAHYYPYWGEGMLGWDEKNPKYEFSEAKARQLLTEAGYPNGVDITLSVITRQPELRIGEMVKSMWDKMGIRTTLESMERLAWIDKVQSGKADAFFWRQAPVPDPDLARRGLVTGAAANWPGYSNPDLDKCMDSGVMEQDAKKRDEIYKQCQKLIYDSAYWGVGYFLPNNFVYHKGVKGVKLVWSRAILTEAWLDK